MNIVQPSDSSEVLSKAVIRAVGILDISHEQLGQILGIDSDKVAQLHRGEYLLGWQQKEWEHAMLFVHVFRLLYVIVDDEQEAREWLKSYNQGLNGRPLELMLQAEGMARVAQYLDAALG